MFKKILVAVDGSATSGRGLKMAINLAKDQNAALLVLNIVDAHAPIMYPEAGYFVEDILEKLRQHGRKVTAAAQREAAKQGVEAQARMAETMGMPVADMIVGEAKRWRADLIVLGTHGRRGLSRAVLGSDAEGVVRMSNAPVMLIRAPERKAASRKGK